MSIRDTVPPTSLSSRVRARAAAGAAAAALLLLASGPATGQEVDEATPPAPDTPAAETSAAKAPAPAGPPATGAPMPAAPRAEPAAASAGGQEATLYERLGGLYPIASVVDVFIDLLYHNDVLNENPAIREARERVPLPGLKYHVTAMVCQATGGPCEYTGRSMEEAHAHLNIGEREWKAMLSDLRRTLNDFRVPEDAQEELIAIVESTKSDIVVRDD